MKQNKAQSSKNRDGYGERRAKMTVFHGGSSPLNMTRDTRHKNLLFLIMSCVDPNVLHVVHFAQCIATHATTGVARLPGPFQNSKLLV